MSQDFTEAFRLFGPGDRVWIAGATGEPSAALDALAADPEIGRGLEFCGVWIPGMNRRDPSALTSEATARAFFVTPALRDGFAAGRVRLHPSHYSNIPAWVREAGLKGAVMQVSPPEAGMVTPGVACDFFDALEASGALLIGQMNPAMPAPPTAPRAPVGRFAALIEAETPLPGLPSGDAGAALETIAARIAAMISPGDIVNIGIGKAADAVLGALKDHRDLGYHAGMISDGAAALIDAGVLSKGVTAGVAIGSPALYERLRRDPAIRFAPVSVTHDATYLAAIPRFVAIGSALSVDLFGQASCETLAGRQVSGIGGATDFQRGGRASKGGRAILALPATAGRAGTSRIVPMLDAAAPASISRADTGIVVTEHGVADIGGLDIDARAAALISVAAPEHRDGLANAWDAARRAM